MKVELLTDHLYLLSTCNQYVVSKDKWSVKNSQIETTLKKGLLLRNERVTNLEVCVCVWLGVGRRFTNHSVPLLLLSGITLDQIC